MRISCSNVFSREQEQQAEHLFQTLLQRVFGGEQWAYDLVAARTDVVDTFTAWRAARASVECKAALRELENWMQEFRAVLRFAARQHIPAPITPGLS